MSIVVNNMADRGATPYFGYEAWKIRIFQRRTYIAPTLSDSRRREAPATSLYGDVTNVGGAIFCDDFDVEFGAGGVNGCGKRHLWRESVCLTDWAVVRGDGHFARARRAHELYREGPGFSPCVDIIDVGSFRPILVVRFYRADRFKQIFVGGRGCVASGAGKTYGLYGKQEQCENCSPEAVFLLSWSDVFWLGFRM